MDVAMSVDLVRAANREIREFLRSCGESGQALPAALFAPERLGPLSCVLARAGGILSPQFLEEAHAKPEIDEYKRNLTELKSRLEQSQVELTLRQDLLRRQFTKLRSTSAWAETFAQTR